jgi:hypothetical protein
MKRPSHKELSSKIRQAIQAVSEGRVNLINPEVIASDALELGYLIGEELIEILNELLSAIQPEHYTGKRPPQRSYEEEIQDLELFAFSLFSDRFDCEIYLKFTLYDDELWIVSLHKSRSK